MPSDSSVKNVKITLSVILIIQNGHNKLKKNKKNPGENAGKKKEN